MTLEWISMKQPSMRPCSRWGHSSCNISDNMLLIYGGYAGINLFYKKLN